MTKTILLTLTYLVGAGELILAIYFWATNSKSEIRKVMALLAFSTSMWVIVNALSGGNQIFAELTYVFGLLLVISLLHFTLIYPYRYQNFDKFHTLGLYLPWLFFSYAILATKTVIVSLPTIDNAGQTIGGPLFPILNILISGAYFISIFLLLISSRKVDGYHRKNVLTMLYSLIIAGFPGIYFGVFQGNQLLPFNYLIGPLASSIWLGATTYIVRKK